MDRNMLKIGGKYMEKGTIYIPRFFFQSLASSLSLIFTCQRSLLIDYSALIRLSLPKENQPCCYPQLHVWPHHKPRHCFKGGVFISLTQKQQSS